MQLRLAQVVGCEQRRVGCAGLRVAQGVGEQLWQVGICGELEAKELYDERSRGAAVGTACVQRLVLQPG
jgi:hypothetical protein